MADTKITDLASLTGAGSASTDLAVVVDVSDTSMAASGTDKKMTLAELATAITTHGALATDAEVSAAVSAHESDTTSVHGITDTSTLYRSGGTDVAVVDGGTGASDAATARTNLGVDYTTLDERTRDTIGTALVAGSNITITPNDGADTITIAASAGGAVATDAIFDAKGDLPVGTGADTAAKLTVGTGGQILAPNSNQSNGLQWVGPLFPVPASSQYIAPQFMNSAVGYTTSTTLNLVEYCPIWIPQRQTFDRQSFFLQTVGSAGAVVRLGIYASTSTGRPGTRILDAGTVATDSGTGMKEITISQALDPGLYWLALVSQTAVCTPRNCANSFTNTWHSVGSNSTIISNPGQEYWQESGVTGALPATATPVSPGASSRGPFFSGLRAA